MLQKWRVSFFRNEEISQVNHGSDSVERYVPEEVKPEVDNSTNVKGDWLSSLREVFFLIFIDFMALLIVFIVVISILYSCFCLYGITKFGTAELSSGGKSRRCSFIVVAWVNISCGLM